MRFALSFALLKAGSSIAARIAMMAMTTSSSMSVKARWSRPSRVAEVRFNFSHKTIMRGAAGESASNAHARQSGGGQFGHEQELIGGPGDIADADFINVAVESFGVAVEITQFVADGKVGILLAQPAVHVATCQQRRLRVRIVQPGPIQLQARRIGEVAIVGDSDMKPRVLRDGIDPVRGCFRPD